MHRRIYIFIIPFSFSLMSVSETDFSPLKVIVVSGLLSSHTGTQDGAVQGLESVLILQEPRGVDATTPP